MSLLHRRISTAATSPPAIRRPLPHLPTTVRFGNLPTRHFIQRLMQRRSFSHHRWINAVKFNDDENRKFDEKTASFRCCFPWRSEVRVPRKLNEKTMSLRCCCAVGEAEEERKRWRSEVRVMVAVAMTVVLGVANRVMYKLALVPLKNYPFFLAQIATFGYVVVYFSILYIRYRAGIVTNEMLSLPQALYMTVGLLEALGAASGMAAGTMLSGASIPILSQTFLVWQLLLSVIFLGRRYNVNQLVGCLLVSLGVIITVASGSSSGPSLTNTGIFWSLLMIFSFFLQAADTILKEIIFLNSADHLKGHSVDLFVVNSFGSAYQALFICLLLPFLSKLWGIPFCQLPSYVKDGAACFLNRNALSTGCNGAPLLPLLFVVVNMCYNISLLHLLKISSAVVSCLASTVSVPLSVFVFTLPLPYLGAGTALPPGFVAGGVILVLGLLCYAWRPSMVPARATT